MEPVRCFTCNAVLRFAELERLTCRADAPLSHKAAFEAMHVSRFCCRRMLLSHPVELEAHLRAFPLRDAERSDYTLHFETEREYVVSTD